MDPMNSREVIRALEQAGWERVAQRGSHVQFRHPYRPGRVTVPHPERDLPLGTLLRLSKQSGLALRNRQ